MKITMICTEFPPNYRGGLGVYIERVTQQLQKDQHDLSLYTLNYPFDLPKKEQRGTLELNRISPCSFTRKGLDKTRGKLSLSAIAYNALNLGMFNWHTFIKIWKQQRKSDIGTLAVHDWMCIPAALMLKKFMKKDIVFHVHSTEMSMNLHGTNGFTPKVAAWLENRIGQVAKRVIVPSQEIKNFLVDQRWEANKIDVVHHGYEDDKLKLAYSRDETDVDAQKAAFKKKVGAKESTKLLMFAGRLITHKGVNTLLDALPMVIKKHHDFKLVFVGSGEAAYQDNMKETIAQHGLEDHVYAYYEQFAQDAVIDHFCMADVCIFPSTYEPFGFVALEAMSLAKPVVLGCGFPAVIKSPDECGYNDEAVSAYAQKDHPAELAEQIIRLLENPTLAEKLGKNAQSYVAKQFQWADTSANTLRVYEHSAVS